MARKKILLVEDVVPLAEAVSDYFAKNNFDMLRATNGKDGLKIALKEKPDLILLDILLPEMGGDEMFKKLRQDGWGKDAKVIILTNLSESKGVARIAEYNPLRYIVKTTVRLDDLMGLIKKALAA